MRLKLRELAILYGLFLKIGLFSIGGGYVMLPMLKDELVRKRKWLEEKELLDYYAIGQATPGIIAINVSTFVGYKRCGIPGALAATAGMIFPSLVAITIIAVFLPFLQDQPLVQKAFKGVRAGVAALLVHTLISLFRKTIKDWFSIILVLGAFFSVLFAGLSPLLIVPASGILGLLNGIIRLKVRK